MLKRDIVKARAYAILRDNISEFFSLKQVYEKVLEQGWKNQNKNQIFVALKQLTDDHLIAKVGHEYGIPKNFNRLKVRRIKLTSPLRHELREVRGNSTMLKRVWQIFERNHRITYRELLATYHNNWGDTTFHKNKQIKKAIAQLLNEGRIGIVGKTYVVVKEDKLTLPCE